MRRTTTLLACLLWVSQLHSHPGEKPVPDPPDPWGDFECELPEAAEAIDVSWAIWFVGEEVAGKQLEIDNFCTTVVAVQGDFESNNLHVRLYPQGMDTTACEQLPTNNVSDSSTANKINQFALNLHNGDVTWQSVHDFTQAGEDPSNTYYEDNKINVYVVAKDLLDGFRGMHLRDIKSVQGDEVISGNLIFVPADTTADTLMHEFAHAFSLDHVNFWNLPKRGRSDWSNEEKKQKQYCAEYDYFDNRCDFRRENYMWAKGTNRNVFSEGQKARVICNDFSALNANGDRDGDVFRCPDWSVADLLTDDDETRPCPRLHDGIYMPAEE